MDEEPETMLRKLVPLSMILMFAMLSLPASAVELTALDIFDGMIHYENDQLSKDPQIQDFHCVITETTAREAITHPEVIIKDYYFMVPTFQLQLIDDQAAFYFDDDLLIVLLESVDLVRERDAEIDDIPCYVIRSVPKDPAFSRYNRTYYVAQDDFRHIRTVSEHSTRELDNLNTVINYTYGTFGEFVLMSGTTSETLDENDNLLATVTTVYSDYEFGVGLDLEFFTAYVEGRTPNAPLD
jgi:hypothetical protein